MYKTLLIGLLLVNIGVTLFLLYRKNKGTVLKNEPVTTPTPPPPRPTIPNMKAVSL